MVEHVWTVLCQKAPIDRDTNDLSLHSVLEEITLLEEPPEVSSKGNVVMIGPLPMTVVSLWARSEADEARLLFMDQLLWLVDSVCAVEPDWTGRKLQWNCNEDTPGDKWVAVIEQCEPWDIIWDKRLQQYTFLDGRSLAPPDRPLRRHMWKIDSPGEYVRVFIQRITPEHVVATLRYQSRRG